MFLRYLCLFKFDRENSFYRNGEYYLPLPDGLMTAIESYMKCKNEENIWRTFDGTVKSSHINRALLKSIFEKTLVQRVDKIWLKWVLRFFPNKGYFWGTGHQENCYTLMVREGLITAESEVSLMDSHDELQEYFNNRGKLVQSDLRFNQIFTIHITEKGYKILNFMKFGFWQAVIFMVIGAILNSLFS